MADELNPTVEADAKTLATQLNQDAPVGVTFTAMANPVDDGWVIKGVDGSGNVVAQVIGVQS